MKTLYLSDLDGTLLNEQAALSPQTIRLLNPCLEEGMLFSVATARSPATAVELLKPLNLRLPVCLLNGSFLYDLSSHTFLQVQEIRREAVKAIVHAADGWKKHPLIYAVKRKELVVYYLQFDNHQTDTFAQNRSQSPYKRFERVPSVEKIPADAQVVFLVFLDTLAVLEKILPTVAGMTDAVHYDCYNDIYHPGEYYLEIAAATACKASAARWLKQACGADRLVAFGDNANDLPMLRAADEAYVPENAAQAVQKAARQVLAAHTTDSVARFIAKDFSRQKGTTTP